MHAANAAGAVWTGAMIGEERVALNLGDKPVDALRLELIEELLDPFPHTAYHTKDFALRYVSANQAMLNLCCVRSRKEIVGKTARDFFPDATRRRYESTDRLVMRTQRPVRDQLDLSVRLRGPPVWLLIGKWPVVGPHRQSLGVVAIARILEAPDRRHPTYARLAAAIECMRADLSAPLDIVELARRTGVSVSQIERDFVSVFGLSPRRYQAKLRFEAALEMLQTDAPIVEIALACGYSEQATFARRFSRAMGMSPSEYRRASRSLG